MKRTFGFMIGLSLLTALAGGLRWYESPTSFLHAAEDGEKESKAVPVEPDMHEFMEYVFEPTYKRLKTQMASEPADKQAWKAIKSDALILAEGGNLLLIHEAEEDHADWLRHSIRVRDVGGQLYRAAKSKDFKAARQHYENMLTNCNACHQQFASGEHQLTP